MTLQRWEDLTRWPLVAFAALYVIAYAVPIAEPDVSPAIARTCTWAMYAIWISFGVDYLVRMGLSHDRLRFFRTHLLDLAVVALPMLRPLSLLRAFMVMQVLNRAWRRGTRNRVIIYAAGSTALLLLMGALTITETERYAPGSTITNLGTGFWWAITTMTTVGYGDTYPVTTTGRFIAAALMIGGVAVLGVLTATLSSWLVERVTEDDDAEHDQTQAQLQAMSERLNDLSTLLAQQANNPEAAKATEKAVHAVEHAARVATGLPPDQVSASAASHDSDAAAPTETDTSPPAER